MDGAQIRRRRWRSQEGKAVNGGEYAQEPDQNRMHLGAAMSNGNMNGNYNGVGQQPDGWHGGPRDQQRRMDNIDPKLEQHGQSGSLQGYSAPHFHPNAMTNEPNRNLPSPWAAPFGQQLPPNLPQYLSFAGPMHHHAPDPYGHHHAPQSLNYPGMPFNVAPPPIPQLPRSQQQLEVAGWHPYPNGEHMRGESTLSGFTPNGPDFVSQNHHEFPTEDTPSSRPTKTKKMGKAEKDGKATGAPSTTPGAKGFVACVPCRQRKIKCNGVRPHCSNCQSKHLECKYDEVVKRRGPDKQPGGRMRKRETKKDDGQDSPKPNVDGSAFTSRRTSANGETDSPYSSRLPSSDFTFGASLQAAVGVAEASNVVPTTQNRFEHMAPDGVFGGALGVATLAPGPMFPGPRAKNLNFYPTVVENDNNSLYVDGSIVVQGPSQPDVEFSWIVPSVQFNDPMVMPGQIQGGGTSPRLGVQDLLIPGANAAGIAHARKSATISPVTDSNDGSDDSSPFREQWTPPQMSLDLERVPNIAYARDQDWAWMAGLFSDRRDQGMAILDLRLREVFDMGLSWFGCINRSSFFAQLHHPVARLEIQPALVLALLACNTLFRTGEDGPTHPGRQLACTYADAARAMIQQSVIANKTDPSLAQAALVLCIFETCPHPQHSLERSAAALKQMDAIMQMFCLFAIDVTDERVSIFLPNQVPKLSIEPATPSSPIEVVSPEIENGVLASEDHSSRDRAAMWSPVPKWPVHWSESDMRKDESRRVAWTASVVVAGFSTWSLAMGIPPLDLYCAQPENYAIFFPAEVLLLSDDQSVVPVGKRTMWALFHRVVLLWHFTVKLYHTPLPEEHKTRVALEILQEVEIIEKSLFESTEESGNLYRWQARDWIINIRKLTTTGLRHKQGLVSASELVYDPKKARNWLATQNKIANTMAKSMSVGGKSVGLPALKNRPMYVWWLLGQAKTACDFYEQDNSLTSAIELAGGMWKAIDMLVECWPCPSVKAVAAAFKYRYDGIVRNRNMQQASLM